MLSWIVRPVLLAAAAITALFVARDAPYFTSAQLAVAILLITILLALAAFIEALLGRGKNGDKSD